MKTRILKFLLLGLICTIESVSAQHSPYVVLQTKDVSQSVVSIQIKTFCADKEMVNYEAACSAVKTAIFYGVPNTKYKNPLLKGGEATLYQQHQPYFDNLFYTRVMDFVPRLAMMSKFKKAGKDKSTLYEIEVDVMMLRKDLEKNKIKRSMGI